MNEYYIFHGSPVKLEIGQTLVPHVSKLLPEKSDGVLFATFELWLAVICIARTTDSVSFGFISDMETGEIEAHVYEECEGGLDALNVGGYVYGLNPEFFFQDRRLMRQEFISLSPATIYTRMYIPNVRQALQQPSKVGRHVKIFPFVRDARDTESKVKTDA